MLLISPSMLAFFWLKGHSILFTHYQIKNSHINEHISKDPFSSIVTPSIENLEKLFEGNNHHHPLHYFIGNKTIYLNPSSLGCNNQLHLMQL